MTTEGRLSSIKYRVSAGQLYAPASFMTTPTRRLVEICNGCGSADAKIDFVPDRIYGTNVAPACHIHDFMYFEGRCIEDKEEADRVFLNNLYRIIKRSDKWYKPKFLMRRRALKYYWAVKYFGGPAFWDGKNLA